MKKYLVLLIITFLFGCSNEEKRYDESFDELVSEPITNSKVIAVEKKVQQAKEELNNQNLTLEEKKKLEKEMDYYLGILDDLKN